MIHFITTAVKTSNPTYIYIISSEGRELSACIFFVSLSVSWNMFSGKYGFAFFQN
jgi:hypothetical protein